MSRKILCVLSEWGFWGEELGGPLDALDKHGYKVVLPRQRENARSHYRRARTSNFIDPPLADVRDMGAVYTYQDVVVEGDLVTGRSGPLCHLFARKIIDMLIEKN